MKYDLTSATVMGVSNVEGEDVDIVPLRWRCGVAGGFLRRRRCWSTVEEDISSLSEFIVVDTVENSGRRDRVLWWRGDRRCVLGRQVR